MRVIQQPNIQLSDGRLQRTEPPKAHEVTCGAGVTLKDKKDGSKKREKKGDEDKPKKKKSD